MRDFMRTGRCVLGIFLMSQVFSSFANAQERAQARSMVISQGGIVATSQTLASQAGAQILARGGSAVDAAITANAVLSVVEPMMNGIGGDLFAIIRDGKTGKLTGINASGWAPKALTVEKLRELNYYSMPTSGIHSVSVPGCVDGWWKLHQKFGRRPWAELFQPAIYFAENGFPVTEIIQFDWENTMAKLAADDNARRVFLRDGQPPKVGEIFKNPQLARALKLIAEGGPDAFYRGPVGKALLKTSKRLGGVMDESDLAEFTSAWEEPISIDYRGWRVYEMPPNGQGVAVLEMLNLMERFPLSSHEQTSPEAFHVKIEAQKLAYLDLRRYNADPKAVAVPYMGMISKKYAAERAAEIDLSRARCDASPGNPPATSGNTIYLATIDRDGTIVSWIQSISDMWGSGVVVDDMGFHLHDRGGHFVTDRSHPNVLAPRKRPFHTIIPALMEKDEMHIGFGIMRGSNQALAHAQFVSNIVDHGMNIQMALEAPRFTRMSGTGCDVMIESRVGAKTVDALESKGHIVNVRGVYSGYMGGGQAVLFDSQSKVKYAGSSPRKDGAAVPEPESYFREAPKPVVRKKK